MSDTNPIIMSIQTQYEHMLNDYASIVEKTNNQLSYSVNLATLSVTILAVIVAVIAICVAWALWKNSKEQRDRTEQFFTEQEKIITERNERDDERRIAAEREFEKLIEEQQAKLKSAKIKNKREIEKFIDELKKEKASVGKYTTATPNAIDYIPMSTQDRFLSAGTIDYLIPFTNKKSMICAKCGKSFDYYDNDLEKYTHIINSKTVYCTNCGNPNIKTNY